MSTMVAELYRALRQAGVDEQTAEAAAKAVWQPEQPATKTDIAALHTDLAALEARLAWRIGTITAASMAAMTGIFAAIVGWLL